MSRHVAPHRWADAFAGRTPEAERRAMDRHAAGCRDCARTRDRIRRASDTFPVLRQQSAPEVAWDHVRARVHWAVSTERRAKVRAPGAMRWLTWGLAAACVATAAVMTGALELSLARDAAPIAKTDGPRAVPHVPVAPTPAALVGLVSRADGEVMIDGIRARDLFERELHAGSVLATADGRVDVQFGDASAFAVGPRSTLELRRFDASMIELVVDGTLDVEVAARAANQRFVVVAGEHTVEVRGTQFRVVRDAHGTAVACRHGLVTVGDGTDLVAVGSARKVEIAPGTPIKAARVVAMSIDELASLAQATPYAMPAWTADAARKYQPLDVLTAGHHDVRVDGVELGVAPLRVRVTPGRHTVEVADASHRFRRAGWVDVDTKPARIEVPAEVGPSTGIAERRRELGVGLDRARLRLCTRTLAKQGLSAHVDFSIEVTASGDVAYLNINDTDLNDTDRRCVESVLRDNRFRRGTAATWHQHLDLF